MSGANVDQGLLRQIENTNTDLRRSEHNTFERHVKKLSRLLHSPELAEITDETYSRSDVRPGSSWSGHSG